MAAHPTEDFRNILWKLEAHHWNCCTPNYHLFDRESCKCVRCALMDDRSQLYAKKVTASYRHCCSLYKQLVFSSLQERSYPYRQTKLICPIRSIGLCREEVEDTVLEHVEKYHWHYITREHQFTTFPSIEDQEVKIILYKEEVFLLSFHLRHDIVLIILTQQGLTESRFYCDVKIESQPKTTKLITYSIKFLIGYTQECLNNLIANERCCRVQGRAIRALKEVGSELKIRVRIEERLSELNFWNPAELCDLNELYTSHFRSFLIGYDGLSLMTY